MPLSRAIGIDLGATRSIVARIDDVGRSLPVRDAQGDLLIPSVVYFEDDELLHGRAAKLAAATKPGRAAEFVKRDLGQAAYSRAIGGELLPPEVIEAFLLKKLSADVAQEGISKPAVVLSTPASFNQSQRRARLDAGLIAGLEVLGTINDPLAAAMLFAESQGYLSEGAGDKSGFRVLVFDLGGSKLDVAIIEIKPGRLRTMSVGGNISLGGREWDLLLAEYLAEQFVKQFGQDPRHDMPSVRRLLQSAEEAKQALSARQQVRVQVERGDDSAGIIVTRQAFEDLTSGLVDQALQVVEATLARAGMAWRDLAHLLLIGGASRMPVLTRRLEELTRLKAAPQVHPDETVARGAALYAECLLAARENRKPNLQVAIVDLTVHSLGLEWRDSQTGRMENVVLIARGTELPCGTVARATTETDDQSTINVQLLEGESRIADECMRIARLTIRDLPAGLPVGTNIDVQYQFSAEGRLQLKATMPKSGQALPISVRRAQGLTESQLAEWRQLIASNSGLKSIHALLPKHRQEQAAQAAAEPQPLVQAARPPALPTATPPEIEDFALRAPHDLTPTRRRKRPPNSQKLGIMAAGYVISAILGLAIGYYILMKIDPSFNWWDLSLPGLD